MRCSSKMAYLDIGCRQAENNKHLETLRNKHTGHCCCLLSVYQLEAMRTVFLTRLLCS